MKRWVSGLSILFVFCIMGIDMKKKRAETTTVESEEQTTKYASIKNYDWDLFCKFQSNGYDCSKDGHGSSKFYFDVKMDDCKTFQYGGCKNNRNIFDSLTACKDQCRESGVHVIGLNYTANIFCRLQPEFGNCEDYQPMFYFDLTTHNCKGFSYSGCGGNQNRFKTAHICNAICSPAVEY